MRIERRTPPAWRDMADPEKTKDLENGLDGDPLIVELRRLYEGVVDEPLPDDLLELLRKLDEVERNR